MEQAQQKDIQRAITHDHTYASTFVSSEEDLVSFEKPSSEEVVTHKEQDQAPLQELSDECENEELSEEPLGQSKDAGSNTILFMKWKLCTIWLF